ESVKGYQKADLAMMSIENTTFGSLMSNYKLLYKNEVKIIGEVSLRIKQNLMCLNGVRINDLREVYSHPIAIAQCEQFFQKYPHIKLVESIDTALAAKHIREKQMPNIGAIASYRAAEIYELDILAESIETNKKNYTRFLALTDHQDESFTLEHGKVSLCFIASHEIGSLYKVLQVLAENEANLTKIQSVPILETDYEYMFFIDFIMGKDKTLLEYLHHMQAYVSEVKVLGNYKKGIHYDH
ncbi:MAG: prephenate dehydratase, partial [Bacteroidota bacterium]